MFFVVSKVAGFFAVPSNFIALVCALGAVLALTRWRRAGLRILAVGIALLLIAAIRRSAMCCC